MKRFLCLCMLVMWPAGAAFTQEKEAEYAVAKLPSAASWTVTYRYRSDEPAAGGSASAAPIRVNPYLNTDRPREVIVTRRGKVCHEESAWVSGAKTDGWIYHNMRLGMMPQTKQIVAQPFSTEGGPDHADYRRIDFEGLGWVGKETFRGTATFNGQDAWVFESPVSGSSEVLKSPAGKWGKSKIAVLSAKTRLPLFFYDGVSERTYKYGSAPTGELVPPQEFLKLFEEWKKGS